MTTIVEHPNKLTDKSTDNLTINFNQRHFVPNINSHFILMRAPNFDENLKFWTEIIKYSPSIVVSINTFGINNIYNKYWEQNILENNNSNNFEIKLTSTKHYIGCIQREFSIKKVTYQF